MSENVSSPKADDQRENDYDAVARAYTDENDRSLANAYYERPAMLALVGDVAGRRVLDAGCGAGALTGELHAKGAAAAGLDSSAQMLRLARDRLPASVDLHEGDLNDRLPFADAEFDDVVASLVLHYLQDWTPALAELRRVLRQGGRLFVSVDHPIVAYNVGDSRPDYLATTSYCFDWELAGQRVPMRFWRRPLHAMFDAFSAAGFRVQQVSEPAPLPEAAALFPEQFQHVVTSPCFLFFSLVAE